MPTKPWLTDAEKEEIRIVVQEQRLFGYTNEEAAKICGERLNRKFGKRDTITRRTYEIIKVDEADRGEVTNWVTTYATRGYLDEYRQWMLNSIFRQQRFAKIFDALTSEDMEQQKKNVHKINSVGRSWREEDILHSSLGLGAPMILQMKNAIDKGLIDEFHTKRELKRDKEPRQDDNEDISTGQFAS